MVTGGSSPFDTILDTNTLDSVRHTTVDDGQEGAKNSTQRHPMNEGELVYTELLNRASGFGSRRGRPAFKLLCAHPLLDSLSVFASWLQF